ncbi:hypothetical protein SAMN04489729_0480 [Amycolatopsis lurida]|uniref:Uncharacterized protein n=1 Tax=Amycolatopsis lurida NRRL 2430 TaxID=1460371 RepID=A0A2P2FKU8_AMYLU|nr:hypothetical protein [Amycolatopsis lurida]KFU77351.1 hypothetical protein BB31_31880 [Amycolatopsis lurida NRRL 2430]SEB35282.1 hypothetical protein SAMN04489729_0480 [Amycolatopsis lurida]
MLTLRAPDGRGDQADDGAEVTNLMLGYGYTVAPENTDDTEQTRARPRARRTRRTRTQVSRSLRAPTVLRFLTAVLRSSRTASNPSMC